MGGICGTRERIKKCGQDFGRKIMRRRWQDNMKTNLGEIGRKDMEWIKTETTS